MAYTINKFNGTVLTVVEDGTIDNNTDIKLVGKNFAGYGEIQNENFVFLLENFANLNPPPRPISGQVWFDSSESKLKFYDGTKFRTTGGAEVSGTTPAGLTIGDFWWNTQNEQLFAFNGSEFILVGPQDAGEGVTQMQSRTVTGTDGLARPVIVSLLNDDVVTVISNQDFELKTETRPADMTGFTLIKKGITLKNTANTAGITAGDFIFWGTASNALKLGGVDASNFVQTGTANFNTLVEFADVGFAVGDSNTLRVFIENNNQGVISNEVGSIIRLRTKNQQGNSIETLKLLPGGIFPGDAGSSLQAVNIGSSSERFQTVFADNFFGTSEKASALVVGGLSRFPSVPTSPNTVVVRDNSGDIRANLFRGVALTAKYADLAEKYTSEFNELPIGTPVSVCKHTEHEVCEAVAGDVVIGIVSDKPALVMNQDSEGQPIALAGRVPVRIVGSINKGDPVWLHHKGTASNTPNGVIIAVALHSSADKSEKLIECVLKI